MARELRLSGLIALLTLIAACRREPSGNPASTGTAGAKAATAVTAPLASKAFYRVDAGAEMPCTHGTTCEAQLVLTALGDYHVNKDYPFKFVGAPTNLLALAGDATFALTDAKHGTLTVTYQPSAAGAQTLAGMFKLSVCSDETCEIEKPELALAVTVR